MIYDFPLLNVVTAYFIHTALPDAKIVLFGEAFDPAKETNTIAVMPHWKVHDEATSSADVTFNAHSLPEMPRREAEAYLRTFDRISRVGFYSENHETAALWSGHPDSAQIKLIDLEPTFRRLRRAYRCRSWMEPGYYECFYEPAAPK
jgi:hypothetical protein